MQTQKLKYLFTAFYKDGTSYQQNAEDKSIKEPDKRSCYFDLDQRQIASFVLKGNGHEYKVDLIDGHFEIDGLSFSMHENPTFTLPNGKKGIADLKDFKLIFFRRHTHTYAVALKENTQKEMGHNIVYRMGWQCNLGGRKFERVMQFE